MYCVNVLCIYTYRTYFENIYIILIYIVYIYIYIYLIHSMCIYVNINTHTCMYIYKLYYSSKIALICSTEQNIKLISYVNILNMFCMCIYIINIHNTHMLRLTHTHTQTQTHAHTLTHSDSHTQTHTLRLTHAQTHTNTDTRARTHTHTHADTHTHTHSDAHTQTHTLTHADTHTRRHACKHTHTHTHSVQEVFWRFKGEVVNRGPELVALGSLEEEVPQKPESRRHERVCLLSSRTFTRLPETPFPEASAGPRGAIVLPSHNRAKCLIKPDCVW